MARYLSFMNSGELPTYLNDHLAGSVAALELVDHLIKTHAGKPLEQFFRTLRNDIAADQDTLRDLMRVFDAEEGSVLKASAWIAEKFGRVKFQLGGEEPGEIGLLEALEGLVLGIKGKQLLWRTMATVLENSPQRGRINFAALEERALEQCERVEAKHLEAARELFGAAQL
jgi:hypothetical protein